MWVSDYSEGVVMSKREEDIRKRAVKIVRLRINHLKSVDKTSDAHITRVLNQEKRLVDCRVFKNYYGLRVNAFIKYGF